MWHRQETRRPTENTNLVPKLKRIQTTRPEHTEVAEWMWTDLTDEVLRSMAFKSNQIALEYYRRGLANG
jgi:very-short-patch-repair endonuclease